MPNYECDCCGACCKGHLIVEAYELDLLREPRLASADPFYVQKTMAETLSLLEDGDRCLVLAAARPCQFLGTDNRCSIYPTRPNTCVGFAAGDEQCQYARQAAGLPLLQPVIDPAVASPSLPYPEECPMTTTTRTFESIAEAIAFRDGVELVGGPSVVVRINEDDPWTIHVERADAIPSALPTNPFDQPAPVPAH